jgi:lantibiotic leader peptide-processing serine protease
VQAPEAWNAGFTGQGVRVAVLDGGLYGAHEDLAANVDVSASASFVPGQAWNFDTGTFWHGTHVAGIIGAAANTVGVIGIAPRSTLIGVKVLHSGSGQFSWVIEGIMYVAMPVSEGEAGAQVINMSLGAVIPSGHGNVDPALKQAVKELVQAIDMATTYAWDRGVTVVAAAGNSAINFDSSKDVVVVPSSNARVISVAATAPLGWAYGETCWPHRWTGCG